MVSQLPPNFPTASLSGGDQSKIEWFFQRYVDGYFEEYRYGHFIMAAYAAVPALLTPDLLYKIWQNFNGYRWAGAPVSIHRVAVSDILLSPMCREVGLELYEMNSEIRLAFLKWLEQEGENPVWKKRELRSIAEIAAFVEEYHHLPNAALYRWGPEFSELQMLEAVSYTRPEQTAAILLSRLQKAAEQQQETEMMRTLDRFVKTGKRLRYLSNETTDQEVLDFYDKHSHILEAWSELVQENSEGFVERIRKDKTLMNYLSKTGKEGVPVKISGTAAEKFRQLTKKNTWIIVAGGTSREKQNPDHDDIHLNNTAFVLESLKKHFVPDEDHLLNLTDANFIKHTVLQTLVSIAAKADKNDDVIIYFSAETMRHEEGDYLECFDSDPAFSDMNGWISAQQIRDLGNRFNCNSITMVLQIDAPATDRWLDPETPSNLVIQSGVKNAMDVKIGDKSCSLFTRELALVLVNYGHVENIRQVFLRTLDAVQRHTPLGERARPEMTGTREGYRRIFKTDNHSMAYLQDLLRDTGFFQLHSTGKWDAATAEALTSFARDKNFGKKESRQFYISELEKLRKAKSESAIPIWLFVFSDPEKKLMYMIEEQQRLRELFENRKEEYAFDAVFLQDPDKAEIRKFFIDAKNRNRIQLIYLAGFDLDGDLVVKDGAFTIQELGRSLDYQDAVDMLILNTCRSDDFAEMATKIGVKYAFGINGKIDDDLAMRSGIHIMEKILDGRNLNEIFPQYYR